LIKSSIPHGQLDLHASTPASCRYSHILSKNYNCKLCSINLSPSMAFNSNDFYDLLQQLITSVTQHPLKLCKIGSLRKDGGGCSKLCILNDISPTYIHHSTGSLWPPYVIGQAIIFLPVVSSIFYLSFCPRLISTVAYWTSAILPHMVWP